MKTWQLQEAKSKFSQVVEMAVAEEAQLITKNGKPVVYIVSTEDYHGSQKPSIKSALYNRPHKDLEISIEREEQSMRELEL
jgi:antitoxin Phd